MGRCWKSVWTSSRLGVLLMKQKIRRIFPLKKRGALWQRVSKNTYAHNNTVTALPSLSGGGAEAAASLISPRGGTVLGLDSYSRERFRSVYGTGLFGNTNRFS